MDKKTESKRQFIKLVANFVSGKLNKNQIVQSYGDIVQGADKIARLIGYNKDQLDILRVAKRQKNGGFEKGYVISEKVLPIRQEVSQNKILRDDQRDSLSGAQKLIAETDAAGIRPTPEKLVRDNIPSIIEKQAKENWEVICKEIADYKKISIEEARKIPHPLKDYHAKVRVVNSQEMLTLLKGKLLEESNEFLAAIEKEDQLEDLADILEIIEAYKNRITRSIY